MDGADLKELEVFGECSTTEKAVEQDPGETFEAVVDRLSACYASPKRNKPGGRARQPFESIGNDGGR